MSYVVMAEENLSVNEAGRSCHEDEPLSVSVYTTASETNSITRAQGHDLNKLGRGSLSDATYQISRL